MKKRLVAILLTVFLLMITGCGRSDSAEELNEADSQILDNTDQTDKEENGDISAEEAENEPIWTKGTQIDGALFQNTGGSKVVKTVSAQKRNQQGC